MFQKWTFNLAACSIILLSGCNVSPLSPANRPRINNNSGDISSNQNGVMSEIAALKNRMDIMAQEIENIQSGLVNSNNRNFGVQIFQGDGGLAVGLVLFAILGIVAFNYKLKADKFRKTAEIFGKQIKSLQNTEIENEVFAAALAGKVEADVYKILKS